MKTFLFFLLVPVFCFSQDCDWIRNEIDDFAKVKVLETEYQRFYQNAWTGHVLNVSGLKIGTEKYLQVSLILRRAFNLYENEKFMLLHENGDVMTLLIPENKTSQNTGYMSPNWYCIQQFPINENQYKELINGKFTKARYHTSEGFIDFELKQKHAENIREVLTCIQ